ncbi:MAG: hypothetical protein AVDCRST_MAG68-3781, partial [uncultured Gemmatimonadetes bacterium]
CLRPLCGSVRTGRPQNRKYLRHNEIGIRLALFRRSRGGRREPGWRSSD